MSGGCSATHFSKSEGELTEKCWKETKVAMRLIKTWQIGKKAEKNRGRACQRVQSPFEVYPWRKVLGSGGKRVSSFDIQLETLDWKRWGKGNTTSRFQEAQSH